MMETELKEVGVQGMMEVRIGGGISLGVDKGRTVS